MYGNLAPHEAEPTASAYPAIVPDISEASSSSLTDRHLLIARVERVEEGVQVQHTLPDKGNSEDNLPTAQVRTQHPGLQPNIACTATPAITPSSSRSGRRSDGKNRENEGNGTAQSSFASPKPHEPQVYRWQLSGSTSKDQVSHQIWYPPVSAYEGSAHNSNTRSDTRKPPSPQTRSSATPETNPPHVGTSGNLEVEEWRLYPPFPSAYPPTPLPASARLPSMAPNTAISTPRRSSAKVQLPPIKETRDHPFRQSLMPYEPSNPGSNTSISDGKISMTGVQIHDSGSGEESMDVDSDDEDSGDTFDVTLRTPVRKRVAKFPVRKVQSNTLSSSRLSTVDNGSTLRTRSNSTSSSSASSSDTSSVVGHKRSFPEMDPPDLQRTIRPTEKIHSEKHSNRDRVRSHHTAPQGTYFPRSRSADTRASETADENESGPSDGQNTKRRRIVNGPRTGNGLQAIKFPTANEVAPSEVPLTITRGRGRNRGLPPSRTSSRIASSRTAQQISRPIQSSSNSSQSTLANVQFSKAIRPPRDSNIKNRK